METDAYISAAPRNASLLTQFGLENQRFARNGRSMIISASYKTDNPAFYGSWFERRLIDGYADVRNVWNGKQFRVDLRPEAVSGFVFWTRNTAPFLNTLQRLNEEDVAFVVQFTSIGYPRQIERSVIGSEVSVEQIRALSRRFGTRSVFWRYDPVFLTDDVDTAWHERNFATLAMALKDHVDEVVLSFAQIYRKSARNLRFAGVNWRDPEVEEKRALLSKLAGIASEANIRPTLCAQPDLLPRDWSWQPVSMQSASPISRETRSKPARKAIARAVFVRNRGTSALMTPVPMAAPIAMQFRIWKRLSTS